MFRKSQTPLAVLVAGIGGASLGTEVAKALHLAGGYSLFGCDISKLAFGHYAGLFASTSLVSRESYIDDLLALCKSHGIRAIVPGGDQPASLIAAAAARFNAIDVALALNAPSVVAMLSNKARCFEELARLGFSIPRTVDLENTDEAGDLPLPCIVKPATASGGSSFVFFARSHSDVRVYAAYLRNNGLHPIAQEYVPHDGGEFTIGVLSLPDCSIAGSAVLQRAFPAKLSIAASAPDFLISSGYSQGYIGPNLVASTAAEEMATALKSTGPINVQGRIDAQGSFLAFEINPRFSASTYLRALAGFNEIDYYIRHLLREPVDVELTIRPGWYLRSLTEVGVSDLEMLK